LVESAIYSKAAALAPIGVAVLQPVLDYLQAPVVLKPLLFAVNVVSLIAMESCFEDLCLQFASVIRSVKMSSNTQG
jgi:hypothetical protein